MSLAEPIADMDRTLDTNEYGGYYEESMSHLMNLLIAPAMAIRVGLGAANTVVANGATNTSII